MKKIYKNNSTTSFIVPQNCKTYLIKIVTSDNIFYRWIFLFIRSFILYTKNNPLNKRLFFLSGRQDVVGNNFPVVWVGILENWERVEEKLERVERLMR